MDGDTAQKLEKALSDLETLAKKYEEVKKENSSLKEEVQSLKIKLRETSAEHEQSKRAAEHPQQKTLPSKVTPKNGFSSVSQNRGKSIIGKAAISNEQKNRLSGFASTSTNESENEGSTRQSHGVMSSSTEQDNPDSRDCTSLSNLSPTSVVTTLPDNYKFLLLTLAERLLSSDVEQLKNWASQNYSVDTSENVTDILFQLDHKKIISASNLSRLRDLFESILRIDLVYIIDAFLCGDYDKLRYNTGKSEVDTKGVGRLRRRVRSDHASPFNGAAFRSASSQYSPEENSEALRRNEKKCDEVRTLVPHLPRQTPFPHSPSEPESRQKSNNSSTSTNPPASQGKNTRTIGSKPRHSKLRLPNSVQGSPCVNCDRKQEPCQRCRRHFPTSPTHLDTAQTSNSQRNERLQNEESRPRSNKSSKSTNQPASQGKNTQTIGSKPRHSELRLPDSRQGSQCVNCASEQGPCELCRQPFPSSPTYLDTCQSFDSQRNEGLQNEAINSSDTLPVDVTHPEVVQERTPTPILIRVLQPTRFAGLEADHDDNKHVDGSAPEVQPVRNPQMEPTEAVCSCNSLPMDVSRPEIVPERTSTPNPVHVSQPTPFEGLEDHHDDRNAGSAPEVRIVGILEMEPTEGGRPVEDPIQNILPTEPPQICYLYTLNNQIVQQETDGPLDELTENEDAQFNEPDPL